jgi:mannitol/fructose-specific phosphotransferase system IIA component (Ntr-type)
MLLEKLLFCLGSPLMLNGKLKSHFELWDALLQVEKMFDTMDDEVIIMPKYFCLSYVFQHAIPQPHMQHLYAIEIKVCRVYGHCATLTVFQISK